MRPTLFRQGNVKLLRYLGGRGTKNLFIDLSKLNIHTRFLATVSSRDNNNNNVLDEIDLYPSVGPLGVTHHDDCVFEISNLFDLMESDSDESRNYFNGLSLSSHLETGYPLLGRQCHGYLLKSGFLLHLYVKASLVRVYTMLSDVLGAMEVLLYYHHRLDTCTYNKILVELVKLGYLNDQSLIVLRSFILAKDMVRNKETYIVIFGLCARLKDLKAGRQVHNKLLKSSDVKYDESVCNAVIKMYGKCKDILSATKVFDRCRPPRNAAIWNSLLAAYSEYEEFDMSLKGFIHMLRENVVPNESTFCILLTASAEYTSLRCGKLLHALAMKTGFKGHKNVDNTLINMYSRTGDIEAAEKVFLGMTGYYTRDIVTWNMMICGYSLHGSGKKSLALFHIMLGLGDFDPNDETFVGVLSACGHLGLVEDGFYYMYELMKPRGVKTGLEHYRCIINMLIKAGQLNEALSFIVSTPSCKRDVVSWSSFLRGCMHDHGNYALGIRAAELIPDDVATRVSKWFGVAQVRELMEISRDIRKEQERGKCWIEIENETRGFESLHKGDPKFDLHHELMMKMFLYCINDVMKTFLHDTDVEDVLVLKGDRDDYHSEELAVAYAFIFGPRHAPICVIKASGKICGDCHTLVKITSKVEPYRLITVRDTYQFHHFRNGHCSCADYW